MTCHGRCFLYEDFLLLEYRKIKRPFPPAAYPHPHIVPLWPPRWCWVCPHAPRRTLLSGRAPEHTRGPLRHWEPSPLPGPREVSRWPAPQGPDRPTCTRALRGYRLIGNDRARPAQTPPKEYGCISRFESCGDHFTLTLDYRAKRLQLTPMLSGRRGD